MTTLVLTSLIALPASACDRTDPVQVERIIASPVATSTPKRVVRRTVAPSQAPDPKPSGRPRRSDLQALVRKVFGRHGDEAVRVANCETGGTWNPAVVNSSGHTGLFQLSPRWHVVRAKRLGFTWAQMREAKPNVLVAFDLFTEQGWGPWTCRSAI